MELILNKILLVLLSILGVITCISAQLSHRNGDFKAAYIQAICAVFVLIAAIIAYFRSV